MPDLATENYFFHLAQGLSVHNIHFNIQLHHLHNIHFNIQLHHLHNIHFNIQSHHSDY